MFKRIQLFVPKTRKNMSGFSKPKLIWWLAGVLFVIAIIFSVYFFKKTDSPIETDIIFRQLREMEKLVKENNFEPLSEEALRIQINEMNDLKKENGWSEVEENIISEQIEEMDKLQN